jgi:hypothetical protein
MQQRTMAMINRRCDVQGQQKPDDEQQGPLTSGPSHFQMMSKQATVTDRGLGVQIARRARTRPNPGLELS